MNNVLNEGAKAKVNRRFKNYASMMSDLIKSFRTEQKGLDAKGLGHIGEYPFIEDQKKELVRSYNNATETFSRVATPESKTTTPQAVSTAAALLYEFFDKFVDAKKLMNEMGLSSITSGDPEVKGLDAARVEAKSAYQRMEKLMTYYKSNNNPSMKQFKRLNDAYNECVNKFDILGKGYRDNFVKYTKKAVTDDDGEISEKALNKMNDAIAKLTMAWAEQMNLLRGDFPTIMAQILSSNEYAQLYSYLVGTVLAEIGKPVEDFTDNSKKDAEDNPQAMHMPEEDPNADADAQSDDIMTRLAAGVEEPDEDTKHLDEMFGQLDESLKTNHIVKSRGRKCTKKIKELLTAFKEDEEGVSTKGVLKGLIKFRSDEKNMGIGIKPFVAAQVHVISDDFQKSKAQFEKAMNGQYNSNESMNEAGEPTVELGGEKDNSTSAAVMSAGSAIIYQFIDKYTNAQNILSGAGVDIEAVRKGEEGGYEKFSSMLNKFKPDDIVNANNKDIASIKQFSKVGESYTKMLGRFESLGKGIIKNFEVYTKQKLEADGNKIGEDELNKLSEVATVLESSWEQKIALFKNDFSSVVKEIVTSEPYQQYYNYIMETILPEMKKNVRGSSAVELPDTPSIVTIVDKRESKDGISTDMYCFDLASNESTTNGEADASLNEAKDKTDAGFTSGALTCCVICHGRDATVRYVREDVDMLIDAVKNKLSAIGVDIENRIRTAAAGDSMVQKVIKYVLNVSNKVKAQGKNAPVFDANQIANATTSLVTKYLDDTKKADDQAAGGDNAADISAQGGQPSGQDNGNNQGANQPDGQGSNGQSGDDSQAQQPETQADNQGGDGQADAEQEKPKKPSRRRSSKNNQADNSGITISYEVGKNISESSNTVELSRTVNIPRDRRTLYILSETMWGDGLVLNPAEKIDDHMFEILESANTYGDLAKIAKANSSIRLVPFAVSETYSVPSARNRFGMLSVGNPLYECAAIVSFDNTEAMNIIDYRLSEVTKITR